MTRFAPLLLLLLAAVAVWLVLSEVHPFGPAPTFGSRPHGAIDAPILRGPDRE